MNLIQKAVSYLARSIGLTDPFLYRELGARPSISGEIVSTASVLGLAAAWACVNLLAGTIASLPLMVYRTRNGARTVASDHPLYRILHDSPNADQTALDFWEFICASVELHGNAYAEVIRAGNGRVIALGVPVAPELMSVRRRDDGALEYEWVDYGVRHIASQDNILHIRGFGGNPLGGLSTLSAGRQTFGLAQAIERASGDTFRNGVRPSGLLKTAGTLNIEQRKQAEELLQEKFAGAINAGRPMLLDRGMDWVQLSISPEDAQMLQSRSFSVEEVCRFFGVPPFMVGHTEKTTSWGTGLEQQTLGFQKFTLRRRLKRIEQALEKQLLSVADRLAGLTIEFNLEGLLRADSAARASFYQQMLTNGVMTINEVRSLENLPPVEGGDVPRMQMQNVPITQSGLGAGQITNQSSPGSGPTLPKPATACWSRAGFPCRPISAARPMAWSRTARLAACRSATWPFASGSSARPAI